MTATKSLRDPKWRPTHPGVSRLTVSEILNEKRTITPDMAMRLGKALGNGPEIWLRMQQTLDLWDLVQLGGYEKIKTLRAA